MVGIAGRPPLLPTARARWVWGARWVRGRGKGCRTEVSRGSRASPFPNHSQGRTLNSKDRAANVQYVQHVFLFYCLLLTQNTGLIDQASTTLVMKSSAFANPTFLAAQAALYQPSSRSEWLIAIIPFRAIKAAMRARPYARISSLHKQVIWDQTTSDLLVYNLQLPNINFKLLMYNLIILPTCTTSNFLTDRTDRTHMTDKTDI